jgi:DHA1 family multidrug resistance protein-like MFS transporter
MNTDSASSSWRRALRVMVSVQFIISAAFSIVPPVIPLLLPHVGIVDAKEISVWSGLVLGVTPLAAGVMAPIWGRVVDSVDRRAIILLACGAASVCTLLMSVSTSPWQLLALRFLMGFFGGHIVAVMAMVSGLCPHDRLGWALGWLSTAQLAGMLLGPLFGGLIADSLDSYRAPFVAGGCASMLVALFVLRLPKQVPPPRNKQPERASTSPVLFHYRELAAVVCILFLTQFAITSAQPIVSLYVQQLVGPVQNLATYAGVAFSVIGVSGLLASPLMGRAGDMIGARTLLSIVLCGAGVMTLMQSYASTYPLFLSGRFAAGLFLAGIMPLANSLVARDVAPGDRGRAFGLTGSATFLGAFLGPLMGGYIGAHQGMASVFQIASLALFSGAILLYTIARLRR